MTHTKKKDQKNNVSCCLQALHCTQTSTCYNGHDNPNLATIHSCKQTMKSQRGDEESSSAAPRRPSPLPLLLVVLLVVASTSFFHSLHELPSSDSSSSSGHSNAIRSSLDNFKQIPTLNKGGPPKPSNEEDPTWVDRQTEKALPNPPLTNGTETFSSCLLVMVSHFFDEMRCLFYLVVFAMSHRVGVPSLN